MRLGIYNGNALVREIDVPEGTLRVGRNDQNDIVLVDPGKTVSRFHAELRVERGTCTLVDLNSQNGTWVAGQRVQQASLAPGQAAVLGTHRLVVEAAEAEPQRHREPQVREHPPETASSAETPTEPEHLGSLAATGETPAPGPVPAGAANAAPPASEIKNWRGAVSSVRAQAPARPVPRSVAAVPSRPAGRIRRLLTFLAGCLCLAAAGVAGGMFWWPAPGAGPTSSVEAGKSAPPQPELGGPPTETPPPAFALPEPGFAAAPREAAPAPTAMAASTTPRAPAPAGGNGATINSRGVEASPRARRAEPAPARQTAEPRVRGVNSAQLLDRARAAIGRGDYAAALGFVQPVMRVDAGNPEALDLLAAVRTQGHDAFGRGRQLDALGRTRDAIVMYDKAVKLLPPDHPSVQTAKERLALLR